ncbi:MAG: SDR family oxidoreductase [Phycisphaerales bacterium]|nr:SDR family oxidoreductase [Phycisphaerales bacterium]MCB9837485.1 SDR family oxidoreductase [Phycisphaera sp.]
MASLSDRVGIITGASAGIGEALTHDLARAGARLVINARREARLAEIASQYPAGQVAVVAGDAGDPKTVTRLLDACKEAHGQEANLVVVNAGRGLRGSVTDSNTEEWDEMIRTNITGACHLMREAARTLRAQLPDPASDASAFDAAWKRLVDTGGPARDIVVIGSTVGRHISPFSSMYGSTKFAVNSLAEALRRELAKFGVRVTLIEPGIVRTEFQESAGYEMDGFGKFMNSISPVLTAQDISRSIMFTISQPAGVHVSDILIRPTRQEYP